METRHLPGLVALSDLKRNKCHYIKVLQEAKEDFLDCVCEILLNVVRLNLHIDKNRKYRLKKHKHTVRQIVTSGLNLKRRRRKILQLANLIVPLISHVLPQISKHCKNE